MILVLSLLYIALMAGLFIYFLIKHDTSRWQVAIGGVLVSALPLLLLRMKRIPFSIPIIIGYFVFIMCSTLLGSIAKFYLHFTWWDSTLHLYKGAYVGFVALTLCKICIPERVLSGVSRWLIFLFVLSLAVFASVLWEIYEFAGDLFYTDTMQRGGNKDTMYDLLAGFAGGLVIAIYGFFQRQTGSSGVEETK